MLSDESDSESVHQLTINEHYAKAFSHRKEREELQKLKDKYGSDADEDDNEEEDSEDLESEDEDGEELTPAVDAAILKTLARIKNKDPRIYYNDNGIFNEEWQKTGDRKLSSRVPKDRTKSKPVTIRQQALDAVLNPMSRTPSPQPVTHVEEQHALRGETIAAFHDAVEDGDDDDDSESLLVPREKTQDELDKDEEDYREFLQREVGDIRHLVTLDDDGAQVRELSPSGSKDGDEGHERKPKRQKTKGSKKSKLEEDQEFLMNYILNRGWIDRSAKRLPTYHEITDGKKGKTTGQSKGKAREGDGYEENVEEGSGDDNETSEDEEFEEVVERFETSYNFRFEETDADVIKTYPRQLPGLVRREDTTRKEARERRKERKQEEMLQKKEEVKKLKALKMKELRAKLEMIGREGGKNVDDTEALQALDLDAEWDPEAHATQMAEIYKEDEEFGEDERPTWDDDIDIADIIPEETSKKSKKKKKKKKDSETPDMDEGVDVDVMDAEKEFVVDGEEEEWDGTEEMRKKKLDEYMDEVYGLDFNDMVGDMPTRFKYTKVPSQAFGLNPAEILMATDVELNQYMGIKKYAPYRRDVRWERDRNEKLRELKQAVTERSAKIGVVNIGESGERPPKKRMGKKERQRLKALADDKDGDGSPEPQNESPVTVQVDKRKRADFEAEEEEELVPSKKKRRRHKKTTQDS